MSLVTLKEVLDGAKRERYAVGAFNAINLEFVEAILEAAENKNSPVIINIAEIHFKYINLENITSIIRKMAIESKVPIVLNLDHGLSINTIIKAIRYGFTSVMFDGSTLSLEDNIKSTREVVKICKSVGISVEGEIGYIGGAEGDASFVNPEDYNSRYLTDPEIAEKFVAETNVDALAVSIGNVHGLYKGRPKFDFERLEKINKKVDIPLVLHGGSDTSDDIFKKTISLGITKINFYSTMAKNCIDTIRNIVCNDTNFTNFPELMKKVKKKLIKLIEEKIEVFGSTDKGFIGKI